MIGEMKTIFYIDGILVLRILTQYPLLDNGFSPASKDVPLGKW